MKAINEAFIRDKLAKNLMLIENGLKLVAVEYHLPNPDGSRGFIDILARDQYDNYVIIEIKRSNQAARQSLHELFKYPALLRQKITVSPDQIRCILVSTHWDELLRPFSEFSRDFKYLVEGYSLKVEASGIIKDVKKIEILPELQKATTPVFSPFYLIFLYREQEARNKTIAKIANRCREFDVVDFCLLSLKFSGNSPNMIIYPYATLFAQIQMSNFELDDLLKKHSDFEDDYPAENLVEVLQGEILKGESLSDTLEIGYPVKFADLIKTWELEGVDRFGKFEPVALFTDEEIVLKLSGVSDGTNTFAFQKVVSPKYKRLWDEAIENTEEVLMFNEKWRAGFLWFMNTIEHELPDATVSIIASDRDFILLDIYHEVMEPETTPFPLLQVFVEDRNKGLLRILSGHLSWDQKTFPHSPRETLPPLLQNMFNLISTLSIFRRHSIKDQRGHANKRRK